MSDQVETGRSWEIMREIMREIRREIRREITRGEVDEHVRAFWEVSLVAADVQQPLPRGRRPRRAGRRRLRELRRVHAARHEEMCKLRSGLISAELSLRRRLGGGATASLLLVRLLGAAGAATATAHR